MTTNETCDALSGCPVSLGASEVSWFTLPCSRKEFAGFFMILVYAYIVYVASSLLCKGLEHLDNTMSAYSKRYPKNGCAKNFKQIIGGVLSPTLGAFPDAIMISVTTESQADVAAGMTLLVSSNALLLTVPWVIALVVGRKNLFNAEGITTVVNHKANELHSLFSRQGWTSTGLTVWSSVMDQAQIMLLSLFPFIVAQFLAFVLSESYMKTACLILSIVCVGVYIFLLWFQLSDISGTGSIFDTYREAINKFEDQMMWIRATGVYGAASKQDLERMFLKVQINAPQFAGVEILRDVKSQHTTVDNTVRKRSLDNSKNEDIETKKIDDVEPKLKINVSPSVQNIKIVKKAGDGKDEEEEDAKIQQLSELDEIEEMRRRSDFAEALKKMNAGERRNMRMRTWALMDRTPIAQMHTILRVWVLATENKLFEDLRDKYEARKIRKEDSVAVTGKKTFEDNNSVSLSLVERFFMFIGFSLFTSSILYAIVQILTSMIIVFIFADPLVNTMLEWAKWLGVPSVIPVMFIPLFTSGEVVSAYNWAQGGFKGKLSMTYTSLYSAVAMNNCLVFGAFLLMIYSNDLVWDFAGESIGLLVTSCVIGTLGSNFFTYTMLHGAFVMSLFPLLALVIYLFASSKAVRAAATTQSELDDIEDDGPLADSAKAVWITFAVFSVASLCYTVWDIVSEYLESRKKIQEQLRDGGKETWGTIKTTVSATATLKEMGKQRASRRRLLEKKAHDTKLRRVLSQTMSRRSSVDSQISVSAKEDADDHNTVKIEMTTIGGDDSFSTKSSADMSPVRHLDKFTNEKLRKTFDRYDTDNDMELDALNLMTAVDELLGIKLSLDHIKEMIQTIDQDNSGTINFEEFTRLFMAAGTDLSPNAVLNKAFRLFAAPDGSGPDNDPNYITLTNLRRVAEMCDVIIQEEDLKEMIAEANIDGDNRISRDEFRVLLQILELDRGFVPETEDFGVVVGE